MAETFSGQWLVEVFQKDAAFSERFIVEGSLGSDGIYPGEMITPAVSVSGQNWSIRFEWNDNAGSDWQESAVRRTGAAYTLQDGLIVFLGADDNFPSRRDGDFNDVVLRCRNLDPQLNPWDPFANPYDFTLPKDVRQEGCKPDYSRKPPRQPGKRKNRRGEV
jgi:hypothetical protein